MERSLVSLSLALLALIYYAPAIYKRLVNHIKVWPPKSHFAISVMLSSIRGYPAEVFSDGRQFGPVHFVYWRDSLFEVCKRNG